MKRINQLKHLHKLCFDDSDEYINFFFNCRYYKDSRVILTEGNKIVFALYQLHCHLHLFDNIAYFPFITGVATHPEFRNRKLATRGFEDLFLSLAVQNVPFVSLYPFNHDFYRKMGFETIIYTLPITAVYEFSPEQYVTIREISFKDTLLLPQLYNKIAEKSKAFRYRSSRDFIELLTEHYLDTNKGYIINLNGKPVGYVLTEGTKFREICLEDISLINRCIELDGYTGYQFSDSGEQYSMARVIDIKEFFNILTYTCKTEKTFTISLTDPVLVENCGCFKMTIADETLVRIDKVEDTEDAIVLDIYDIIKLGFGKKQHIKKSLPSGFLDIFPTFNLFMFDQY